MVQNRLFILNDQVTKYPVTHLFCVITLFMAVKAMMVCVYVPTKLSTLHLHYQKIEKLLYLNICNIMSNGIIL